METRERAEALYEEARRRHEKGDFRALERISTELLDLSEAAGDHVGLARAFNFLGSVALNNADGDGAENYYRSALEHYETAGDRRGMAIINLNLGCIAADIRMDLSEARERWEQSLAVFREYQDTSRIAIALANLGEMYRLEGDYATAFQYGTESLALFRIIGDATRSAWQLINIAHYRLLRREYTDAVTALREAFENLREDQNPEQIANYFETWFILAVELQRYTSATRILGFLERYRQEEGIPRLPSAMPWFTPRYTRLQTRVYEGDFEKWRDEGAAMSVIEADQATYSVVVPLK